MSERERFEEWEVHIAATTRHGYDIQTVGGGKLIAYNVQNRPHAYMMAAAPKMLRLLKEFVRGFAIHPQCDCGVCDARTVIADIESKAE